MPVGLNIEPKVDDPQRLIELNGVPQKFWLSAEEINSMIKALSALLGEESALYKGEYDFLYELEEAHPLAEPGSEAQIIVIDGDNQKASWDNTNRKWFLDGVYVTPGSDAAYLLKSVYDADGDGKIDIAKNILGMIGAGANKYYGTDANGNAGIFTLPTGTSGGEPSVPGTTSHGIVSLNSGYIDGLNFQPTLVWDFIGSRFSKTKPITLAAAPATAGTSRIDVLAGTNDGDIIIITGIPSANPEKPVVDPDTQIEATFFIVEANATAPAGVTGTPIYNEFGTTAGGEWNATESTGGARIQLLSGSQTKVGNYAIEASATRFADKVVFTPAAPLPIADIKEVSFYIKNKPGDPGRADAFSVMLYGTENNGKISRVWITAPSSNGYDSKNTIDWQFVSLQIPTGTKLANIEYIHIRNEADTLNAFGFFLDAVKYSNGTTDNNTPTTGGASKEYVDAGDAALQDQVTNHEGRIQTLEASMAGGAVVAYETMDALYLAQANQVANGSYRVDDASGHSQVQAGRAWFDYKGTTAGNETDYILRSEEESLNLDAQLTAIENRLTAVENGKANKYGTREVLAAAQIDWADGVDVHTKTITAALALTEINLPQGANVFIKKLIISGNFPVTMPGAHYVWKGGEAGGVSDAYVFDCINGNAGSLRIEYTITPNA